jgi:hypothetical protein
MPVPQDPMVGSAVLASLALMGGAQEPARFCPQPQPKPHEPDGFYVRSTTVYIRAGIVQIGLITRRTDHLEYFRARYGPHVVTYVIATELTSPECAEILSYRAAPDGLSLQLR